MEGKSYDDVDSFNVLLRQLFGSPEEGTSRTRVFRGPTGFDAKTIREEFLKKAKVHPVTSEDKPVLVTTMKYYAKCQPKQDLLIFINLFLKYGNNIQKALRELKISLVISRKCALYGIETHAKGKNLRRNQLTLSRIARAFPTHTALIAMKTKTEGILPYSSFFIQKLPLIMQHSFFPGLIPVKQFTDELRRITLILNMEISMILSRGTFDEYMNTVGELIESSEKYVDAGINNGIDDDKKLEVLTKAEILVLNADGKLELAEKTVALVNKVEKVKEVYSLTYDDAIKKLNLEEIEGTVAVE